MFLFAMALIALVLAFRIICTLLFLGSPLVLVAHAYIKANRKADPPSPDPFIDTDLNIAALELSASISDLHGLIAGYYEAGDAEGLKRTDKSAGTRFDARKALGRELNDAITVAEESIHAQQPLLAEALQKQQANKDGYVQALRDWLRPKASSRAIAIAITVFAATLVLSLVFSIGDIALSVVFFDAFGVSGSVVAACIIGALTWIIACRVTLGEELRRSMLLERYDELSAQLAIARLNEEEQIGSDPTSAQTDPDADETWHDVLNVDSDATTDEIKAAYRAAVKQYHPDSVQGRGAKIVELAENETRRLNEAYTRAREARGF